MAIEKDMGAGGSYIMPDEFLDDGTSPEIANAEMDVIELNMALQEEAKNVYEFNDGSAVVGDYEEETEDEEIAFEGNLADLMESGDLEMIASTLVSEIDDDIASREDWEDTYKKGLLYLGMKSEERTNPFEGASGVVHPLLAESVTQFQAQAYRELLPANGPVRTQVVGQQTYELVKQAERVKEYMNYEITYRMEEYDPEMDQMLFYLPLVGSTFKKVYFDPLKGRAVSRFVHAEDMIVPYGAVDLASAPRYTHSITMNSNDVRKLQLSGFYSDIDLPTPSVGEDEIDEIQESIDDIQGLHPGNKSEELTIYEVHTDLDIEGFEDEDSSGEPTGLKLPYIVTILKNNGKVLSIRRNYEESDPMKNRKPYFVHYKFLPGLGFYGLGLTHMIGGLAQASTSILRQLIDAGTLANLPAGFKARGARIRDDDTPLQPGEFRDIDVVSGDLRGSLMPLPFKEPSATLYSLLGTLVDAGRRFASMADVQIGEMGGEAPVGTTIAIMERGTKVMSAIHKRMHYAQKLEFKLLAKIFSKTMEAYPYALEGVPSEIKVQDFDDRVDVLPVSDPNIFSMAQRISLAQTQLQLVQSNPQIHGGPQGLYQAYHKMYEALGINNIDSILPPPPQPQPINAAKENQAALMGGPLQAFPEQDHQSHIAAHMAMMSTPIMQVNPQAAMALQGHIQEHIGMMAEAQAQQQFMAQVPPQISSNPQAMEKIMAQMKPRIDAAASQIIAQTIEEFSKSVTPPEKEDPLVQIRNQELQIKAMESQRRSEESQAKQAQQSEAERNKVLIAQQRIDISDQALEDKTRVANERIQTQRDIAQLNASVKRGM